MAPGRGWDVSALTGDFDAVLQVSGPTLNRLAASMHQNGFTDEALPSLPHIAHFRLDGPASPDSERGSVAAQIGTSLVELIDGATDRFWIEMGFRARYRADPGSPPLADVIHGTIRAMYRLESVAKSCPGWSEIAAEYLWLRVVPSSVTFNGSAQNDMAGPLQMEPPDKNRIQQRIGQHLANLLAKQFQPNPHPLASQFRRLITRSTQQWSGVAFPLELGGDGSPAGGDPASIRQLFLGDHDFAVGVSADYIVRTIQSMVDDMDGRTVNIFHRRSDPGGSLTIDYHVRMGSATAEWVGAMPLQIPAGLIRIRAQAVGWASKLDRSGVYNIGSVRADDLKMTATIEQLLMMQFDTKPPRLVVSAFGDPAVHIGYGGPFEDEVVPAARGTAAAQVKTEIAAKLNVAQSELDNLAIESKKQALVDQLAKIDGAATAQFDGASFTPHGIVLHGSIRLTHRHLPRAEFDKPKGGDHFNAIHSWIPGGRIDSFEWSWQWFSNPVQKPPGTGGSRSESSSFLLTRGLASRNHFGLTRGVTDPLPGLDGNGRVCLTIKGVHVHPLTGSVVPVQSVVECAEFGYRFKMPVEVGPYLRVCDPLVAAVEGVYPEVGLLRMAADADTDGTHNSLVLYLGDQFSDEAADALTAGVEGCTREFAGLLTLVLFSDGTLTSPRDGLRDKLSRLTENLVAPVLMAEDVNARWSSYFGFFAAEHNPSWRLLTPGGVVAWSHDGMLRNSALTEALTEHLVASHPPQAERARNTLRVGDRLRPWPTPGDCPPIPLERSGGVRVAFVDTGVASAEMLKRLPTNEGDFKEPPCIAVVVDGASDEQVQHLKRQLNLDIPLFADPTGSLTRNAGVVLTPTVFTLDSRGRRVLSTEKARR